MASRRVFITSGPALPGRSMPARRKSAAQYTYSKSPHQQSKRVTCPAVSVPCAVLSIRRRNGRNEGHPRGVAGRDAHQFHPPGNRRRRGGGKGAGRGRDAIPARTQRLPAHRARKVDLPEFRDRTRLSGSRVPPAVRRHEPDEGARRLHGGNPGRRSLARIRLGRSAPPCLRLLRASVRLRGTADRVRQRLRVQPPARGDSRLARHPHRAGARQPVSLALRRGEPRSLRAHAWRRVRGRSPCAAGEDRHGLSQHEPPGSGDLPDHAHTASGDRPRLVRLSHVRLRAGALGCHRRSDPLAVHARVRGPSPALRMVSRDVGDSVSTAPDRVRPPEPDPFRHEQALSHPAGGWRTCRRMGRPAHAHHRRDAEAGVHAAGAA